MKLSDTKRGKSPSTKKSDEESPPSTESLPVSIESIVTPPIPNHRQIEQHSSDVTETRPDSTKSTSPLPRNSRKQIRTPQSVKRNEVNKESCQKTILEESKNKKTDAKNGKCFSGRRKIDDGRKKGVEASPNCDKRLGWNSNPKLEYESSRKHTMYDQRPKTPNGNSKKRASPDNEAVEASKQKLEEKDKELNALKAKIEELELELQEFRFLHNNKSSKNEVPSYDELLKKNNVLEEELNETKEKLKEAELKLKIYEEGRNNFPNIADLKKMFQGIMHEQNKWLGKGFNEIKDEINNLHSKAKSDKNRSEMWPRRRIDSSADKDLCWRGHKNCLLNNIQFQKIADLLQEDWKRLLRELDVKEYRIEDIESDSRKPKVSEKAYQGLLSWQKSQMVQAAKCRLKECLLKINRCDIIRQLDSTDKESSKAVDHELNKGALQQEHPSEIFINSPNEYLGKQEDIDTIRKFCNHTEGPRLLYINGLPGAGKKELLFKALTTIDRRKVIEPNFYERDDNMVNWTFKEFLTLVQKTWMSRFPDSNLQRVTNDSLSQVLLTAKDVILILKLETIFGDTDVARNIWSFIYAITQGNGSNLKVIVSSCKHPEEILMRDSIEYIQIALRGLEQDISIKFLQKSNQKLKTEHGKTIWHFFGGNPHLLLKVNAYLKHFQNFDEDITDLIASITSDRKREDFVRRIVQGSWWTKMSDVIEAMDDNERVVLAKLSVFKGFIPKCLLSVIMDNETRHEASHFYTYHCILSIQNQRNAYQLAPIYRVFLTMYAKMDSKIRSYITDGEKKLTLQEIKENAFKRVVECFNQVLWSITHLFLNDDVQLDDCTKKLVEEYQNNCSLCQKKEESLCQCPNVKIAMRIFHDHRTMLIKSFEDYYDNQYQNEKVGGLDLVKVFLFLKIMGQCYQMKFQPIDIESKKNECNSLPVSYYRYLVKTMCERQHMTLERITILLATLCEKKYNDSSYLLVKFYLQLAKAKSFAIAGKEYKSCIVQLKNSRKTLLELEKDSVEGDLNDDNWFYFPTYFKSYLLYHYLQTAGEITYQMGQFKTSKQIWDSLFVLAHTNFTEDHPIKANCFYQMAKCRWQLGDHSQSTLDNFKKAKQIFSDLDLQMKENEISDELNELKCFESPCDIEKYL